MPDEKPSPPPDVRPAPPPRRWLAALALLGTGAMLALLAVRHPTEVAWLPRCPTKSLLDLDCAGCGTGRAIHHLLQGDVAQAWRHNPALILLGLPLGAWLAIHLLLVAARGRGLPNPIRSRAWMGWAVLALLVIYTALRNIPALDWLRPPGG